jgi:hypothetical protein
MRRLLPVLTVALVWAGSARAQGVLVPTSGDVPPLAMRSHEVKVTIQDQAASTKVVQTFRNDTSRQLEATYVFPVPKGASVRKFVMWVDGKEVPGELVEAEKARQIYNRSIPTSSAALRTPVCSSTSATTCCASACSPCPRTASRSWPSASPPWPAATRA